MALGDIISIINSSASEPKPFYGNRLMPGGGTLIVSNNPETVSEAGATYRDTVKGACRICMHHQNRFKNTMPAQILVVIENCGQNPVEVVVERQGEMTSPDPQAAGYQALLQFITPQRPASVVIQPQRFVVWGSQRTPYMDTFSAMYDFFSQDLVNVHILCLEEFQPIQNPTGLPVLPLAYLPNGRHTIRGTFPYREVRGTFTYYAGSAWRGVQFGNDPYGNYQHDSWWDWNWSQVYQGEYPVGINAVDQTPVYNWGNYGVFYRLDIAITHIAPGLQVTGIYLNPRGGSYFGPLQMQERIIPVTRPIEPLREAVELETGMTMTGMTCHVPIRFMPPGGSSLPVRILVGNVRTLEV